MCIHEASNHGHRDVVELLLDNGAQSAINDKGGVTCDGITPIYDAASNGHLSVVQLLLDRGAKATIKTDANQTVLDALLFWHESHKGSLSTTEQEFYEEIKERLVQQCEKVGIDTSKKHSMASSGYSSIKSQTSQRHNMRYNTDFSDDERENENNDDDIYYDNKKNSSRDNNNVDEDNIKKTARHEYKSVMAKLKNKHKESKFIVDNVEDTRKRSAYLNEAEIAVDDWLDDDLGPMKKKQKKFFNENVPLNEKSPIKTIHTQNFTRKQSINLIGSDSDDECENSSDLGSNSVDAFDVMMSTNGEGSKKKSRRNSNAKLQRKRSNQSSLLDAGFSKFIEFDDSSRKSYSPVKASSTSLNSFSLNESFNRSNQLEKQTIIKVQIDDEKIIVPINRDAANELRISWLIEESARRYYW